MGIPFIDALIGFGGMLRGACPRPYYGGSYNVFSTPYYGGGYNGGWAGIFGFRRDPFIPNPYGYRDYLGNMAYNFYNMSGMDSNAYRMAEDYNFDYNLMGMQLYPNNYRAYNFSGKTHFVYNPDAGYYNPASSYSNPQIEMQRAANVVKSGSEYHINTFKQYRDRQMQVLTNLEGYAKKLKECGEDDKAEKVQEKIDELKKAVEKFDKAMAAACDGKDLSTQEVLYATDAVLKDFKKEFMSECGEYYSDVKELMEEAEKYEKEIKSQNSEDGTEENNVSETNKKKSEKNNEKLDKDNFPEVKISTAKKSGETKKTTSTNGDVEITTFKNDDGDVLRTVERTLKDGKVTEEVEKDQNGNIVKQINYRKGRVKSSYEVTDDETIEITYDKKGNVSKIVEKDKNGNEISVIEAVRKGYKKTIHNSDGTEAVVEFNENGLPTKKTILNGRSKVSSEEYKYSGEKKKETIKYDSRGKETSRISYEYDDDSKVPSSATERSKGGDIIAKYEYAYDNDGRLSEEKKIKKDGSYTITEYEYDKYGRAVRTVKNYDENDNEV